MLSIKTHDETKDELVEEKLSNVNFMQLSDEKENEVENKKNLLGFHIEYLSKLKYFLIK